MMMEVSEVVALLNKLQLEESMKRTLSHIACIYPTRDYFEKY